MEESVGLDFSSVLDEWERLGFEEVYVELRTAPGSSGTEREFIDIVNDLIQVEEDSGSPLLTHGSTRSPDGFVTLVGAAFDDTHMERWLRSLASRLTVSGFRGTLVGRAAAPRPSWLSPLEPALHTGFVMWELDPPTMNTDRRQPRRWLVDDTATSRICDHLAEWAEPAGDETHIGRDVFGYHWSDSPTVATQLTEAILETNRARLIRYDIAAETSRSAVLAPYNEAVLQSVARGASWSDTVGFLRQVLTGLPELTTLAFIRPAPRLASSWFDLDHPQPLDSTTASHIRPNIHLLDRYVPDAHGMQVLTDAHLDNAHDLSAWTILDLGYGRHLVEAADLAPWYSHTLPDPDTLARARRDFGPLILTDDTAATNS